MLPYTTSKSSKIYLQNMASDNIDNNTVSYHSSN